MYHINACKHARTTMLKNDRLCTCEILGYSQDSKCSNVVSAR